VTGSVIEPSQQVLASYLEEHEAGLIALRRQLHMRPEIGGHEVATTHAIERRLQAAGLQPSRLAVGTGLVCDLGDSAGGGPLVALRADIDALALVDDKLVPYRSQIGGVAHACGHDVHTAAVVGAGEALARILAESEVPGRVRLIFEPREESARPGALDVIDEGWLDGVQAIFGLHCDPKLDVGRIGCRVGAITSAADMVEIHVSGPGGHTARPHLTVDLVGVLGRIITGLPVALDERTGSARVLSMVFGAVHSGEASNVVPARGVLRGTLRTPDREAWALAPLLLEQAVAEVLSGTGATWEIDHQRGVPPVVNDPAATELLAASSQLALGEGAVSPTEHSMGGDSFAWYLEHVPGSYARLGVHDPTSTAPRLDLHAGSFDVDERAIGHGVRVLTTTAVSALRRLAETGAL